MIQYTGFTYCPRCGSESLETFNNNGLRCKQCRFTYFHNTASAVGAFIVTAGGILLVRRTRQPGAGFLDVPGGFVDYGERLESALQREIREELAIEITDWRYLCSFPNTYHYESVTYHTTDCFFICHYDEKETPVPNDEISEIVLVDDLSAFSPDRMAFDSARAALTLFKNDWGKSRIRKSQIRKSEI